MGRFLAGVASALLMVAGGIFLWSGLANRDTGVPAPPAVVQALTGSAAAAPADPPQASEKTREEKRFARYDRNKDGKVDRDEYLLARRKAFARLDTDGDGKLSFEEYAVKTSAKFATADGDKSGALDASEFATTRVVRKTKPLVHCPPAAAPSEADDG
jgi:hypothetical protein